MLPLCFQGLALLNPNIDVLSKKNPSATVTLGYREHIGTDTPSGLSGISGQGWTWQEYLFLILYLFWQTRHPWVLL